MRDRSSASASEKTCDGGNQNHKTLPKFEGVDTPENGSRPNAESELFVVENQVPADEVHRFVLFKVSLSAW
jgi:hypothetical protein